MMIDVNCPYCESAQLIAIDDTGGADEDTKFEHLCRSCDTSFAYTVQIRLTATATPARCIDSGELEAVCGLLCAAAIVQIETAEQLYNPGLSKIQPHE